MATLDLEVFRAAAATIKQINGHNEGIDLAPIERAATALDSFTTDLDAFKREDVVIRSHLRGGGVRLGQKFVNDDPLFHLLREMKGNARRILAIDETRRTRTMTFFEGVAGIT